MTQEALKLALEALEKNTKHLPADFDYHFEAITAIKEALAQTQEPVAVYGYCPECGAKGVMRERRPNGNDKCANGHTYPSRLYA
jgi:Zn finger protein HypA/HybF involved in hydrogenase expression